MNRVDRSPIWLTLAGALLLIAVIAYLINEAEQNLQQKEAVLRESEALRFQKEQVIQGRIMYQAESDRMNRERAELHSQQDTIIKTLKRIEADRRNPWIRQFN